MTVSSESTDIPAKREDGGMVCWLRFRESTVFMTRMKPNDPDLKLKTYSADNKIVTWM